jgi:bifunctional non-homologous end joining protein LigD
MQGSKYGKKDNWLFIKMKDEFARAQSNGKHEQAHAGKTTDRKRAAAATSRTSKTSSTPAGAVRLTHPDKLMYPEDGVTKADVFEFYKKISSRLLPHLRDRPATLERLPDGIGPGKPHFWQKNTPSQYPDWIPRIDLPSEAGKSVQFVLVNNEETLLYLVNQGALTFHVWFSRVANLDRPDFVLFDLDRSEASFADVVTVAHTLHEIFEKENRPAFVKTTGKTGLHVLVSWESEGGYDHARSWAATIAAEIVKALPRQATVERSKSKRGRRVYVDVMQNARGRHAVPPYVLRPVPGAPVSTPLNWREVTPELNPADFNIKTIFRRLQRQKSDPMAGLLTFS